MHRTSRQRSGPQHSSFWQPLIDLASGMASICCGTSVKVCPCHHHPVGPEAAGPWSDSLSWAFFHGGPRCHVRPRPHPQHLSGGPPASAGRVKEGGAANLNLFRGAWMCLVLRWSGTRWFPVNKQASPRALKPAATNMLMFESWPSKLRISFTTTLQILVIPGSTDGHHLGAQIEPLREHGAWVAQRTPGAR